MPKIIYNKIHSHFEFIPYGKKDTRGQPTPPTNSHFAIRAYGSNCGEIKETDLQLLRPKSWHFIHSHISIDVLKERFCSLDYSISTDSVRQCSLGKQELVHLYEQSFGL